MKMTALTGVPLLYKVQQLLQKLLGVFDSYATVGGLSLASFH